MIKKILLLSLLFTLFFTGCIPKQDDVKDVFQTNAATILKHDYKKILTHLREFKTKLDSRNPTSYDKKLSSKIYNLIDSSEKIFLMKYKNIVLDNYKDYLQLAFSKDDIPARNDYLVLGLYYMVFEAYELDKGHRLLALEYDVKKLQKLYKNLQIIKWKIKVDRDLNGDYLFLTWQNNWQIELEKKFKDKSFTSDDLENLEYIKNKKESIYSYSNFSFEVILTQMMDATGNSIRALGDEPRDLGVSALKMFIFL
ncbi:MAG: hypothetical protein ACNI25_11005 [Halarcobacter sp.]